ncbi:MAG: hypothetical protein ACXAC7_20810 [Candidatus Hodarchaeales archaeon]|jgi:predicted DNA-binding protein
MVSNENSDKSALNPAAKSVNLTIRVSLDFKNELLSTAKKISIPYSEYVRNAIEKSMSEDQKQILLKSQISTRLNTTGIPSHTPAGKFYIAFSHVIANDVNLPTDVIYNICERYFLKQGYTGEIHDRATREEREIMFMNILDHLKQEYSISKAAIMVVKSIFMTHLSYNFPSPIFTISGSSLDIINLIKELKELE